MEKLKKLVLAKSAAMNKFYFTTPIYYVNSDPHVGHAYTNIIADCMTRFKRLQGKEAFLITGTDEHGEKIKKRANELEESIEEFVARYSDNFKSLWKKLNVDYDFFIRTTCAEHKEVVKKVIISLEKSGDIYKKKYKGYYCIPCETFWTKSQLKDSKVCPECSRGVDILEEENYFFKLSKYQDWLIKHLKKNNLKDKNHVFVRPKERYNEVLSFLEKNVLEDLCISRPRERLSWGVDFPLDDNYVVYVWFDALINYISGAGYGIDDKKFKSLWPADVHFMAKDILRHHAIFWPIMLKALGVEIPKTILAHGWWNFQGEKMSKSRGNIVNPLDLISALTKSLGHEQIAVDALRYFLLREVPIGSDGTFSWEALVRRINYDLANDLGNLVFRTLNMAEKYFKGEISPKNCDIPMEFKKKLTYLGEERYEWLMDNMEFSVAIEDVFEFVRIMNKYVEDTKPWALWKENKKDEIESFLYSLLEGIRIVAIYLSPFMPTVSQSIYRQLGLDEKGILLSKNKWGLKDKFKIKKETPLFPRIDVN